MTQNIVVAAFCLIISYWMKQQIKISDEISALYVRNQRIFRLFLSIMFGIVGCSWFLLLLPDSIVSAHKHDLFRLGQFELYVLLLTLWGYDYRCETTRLAWLITTSSEMNKPANYIALNDVITADKLHIFEMFVKHGNSNRNYFHIVFRWALILAILTLFIRQWINLFG